MCVSASVVSVNFPDFRECVRLRTEETGIGGETESFATPFLDTAYFDAHLTVLIWVVQSINNTNKWPFRTRNTI